MDNSHVLLYCPQVFLQEGGMGELLPVLQQARERLQRVCSACGISV